MSQKNAAERHSMTLELVKAQLHKEDSDKKAAQDAEQRREEACRKAFEPIRAMWIEISNGPDESVNHELKGSVSADMPHKLEFVSLPGYSSFLLQAFGSTASDVRLYYSVAGGGMGPARTLEEVQAEFIKYLARRLRYSREKLGI